MGKNLVADLRFLSYPAVLFRISDHGRTHSGCDWYRGAGNRGILHVW